MNQSLNNVINKKFIDAFLHIRSKLITLLKSLELYLLFKNWVNYEEYIEFTHIPVEPFPISWLFKIVFKKYTISLEETGGSKRAIEHETSTVTDLCKNKIKI